jgi:RimJ/RimL family protein N-acetyltransferase
VAPADPRVGFRIETERLVIRAWRPEERAAFARLAQDPQVVRYISDGVPWDDARIDELLERQARHVAVHGYCLGALCLREAEPVVGLCGMQPLGRTPEVEVGWWLAPEHQGRGYAVEAARAVVRFAFERAGRTRVLAIAHPENRRSIRIMEKLGMDFVAKQTGRELGLRDPDALVVTYRLDAGGGAPADADSLA